MRNICCAANHEILDSSPTKAHGIHTPGTLSATSDDGLLAGRPSRRGNHGLNGDAAPSDRRAGPPQRMRRWIDLELLGAGIRPATSK